MKHLEPEDASIYKYIKNYLTKMFNTFYYSTTVATLFLFPLTNKWVY